LAATAPNFPFFHLSSGSQIALLRSESISDTKSHLSNSKWNFERVLACLIWRARG